MTKAGFTQEGLRREVVYKNGKYIDMILMGVTRKDYQDYIARTNYWGDEK